MFTLDYIEKCLNLKGVIVENIAEEQHTYISLPLHTKGTVLFVANMV